MTHETEKPRLTVAGARRADARGDRLARALRENLMKRKAQQRARDAAASADPSPPSGERDAKA